MITLEEYFLLFVIYSFSGWCMETTFVSLENKKFIDRGFLFGPSCPIYGIGAISIVHFLGKFSSNPILLFFMIIVICGILEYLTSLVMEVVFKARWWDYSEKKININGRVCLENLLAFGILGLAVVYVLNPFFINIIRSFPEEVKKWAVIIFGIIYITDLIISVSVVLGFRKVTEKVNKEKKGDNTEQITKMVRDLFANKSFFHRRFINAYPKLEAIQIKIKEIKNKIETVTNDAKDAVVEKKDEIKSNIEKGTSQVKSKIEEKIKRK